MTLDPKNDRQHRGISRRSVVTGAALTVPLAAMMAAPTASAAPRVSQIASPTGGRITIDDVGIPLNRDGITDDSAAFQALFDAGTDLLVTKGSYAVANVSSVAFDNTRLAFEPGTVIYLKGAARAFKVEKNGFSLDGNGVVLDGSGLTSSQEPLAILGTVSARISDISVDHIVVRNTPLITQVGQQTGRAAIDFKYVDRINLQNIRVTDWAYDNTAGFECYHIGFFYCTAVKAIGINLDHGYIGIEFQQCVDVDITQFTITNFKDNGVYILANSDQIRFTQGQIRDTEEGIVILSPNVSITAVSFVGSTNKGISTRRADYAKITQCHFEGNSLAIGDSDQFASAFLKISNNTFRNNGSSGGVILLQRTTNLEIAFNDFDENTATGDLVRINNRSDAPTSFPRVSHNRLRSVGKLAANAIRISGPVSGAEIGFNTFIEAAVAIRLFDDGSGTPTGAFVTYNIFRDVTTPTLSSGTSNAKIVLYP